MRCRNHRKHMRLHFVLSFLSCVSCHLWRARKMIYSSCSAYIHQYIMQIVKIPSDVSSREKPYAPVPTPSPCRIFVYFLLKFPRKSVERTSIVFRHFIWILLREQYVRTRSANASENEKLVVKLCIDGGMPFYFQVCSTLQSAYGINIWRLAHAEIASRTMYPGNW